MKSCLDKPGSRKHVQKVAFELEPEIKTFIIPKSSKPQKAFPTQKDLPVHQGTYDPDTNDAWELERRRHNIESGLSQALIEA